MNADWEQRLKTAYDAGYYRTEAALGQQSPFPWQNKTCRDCPFWLNNICRVMAAQRDPDTHTCSYYDAVNHAAGQAVIDARMRAVRRMWWGRK